MHKLPNWLLRLVYSSFVGEIYPEIRAIVFKYNGDDTLLLRYYLARTPKEEDFDRVSEMMTNIESGLTSKSSLKYIRDELIYSDKKLKDLDSIDGFLYARRERFD